MIPNTRLVKIPAALLLLYLFSCEHPTEPKPDPRPDTTSHHFMWDIDTIGYRNITLSDGVIINENDMWVVGKIYPDSASYWNSVQYGAAHWDGKKWTPIQLPVKTLAGYTGNLPPTGIIKISDTKYWMIAGSVHEFDGGKITNSWWIHNFYGNPNPVFEEGKNPTRLYQTPDGTVYCYGYGGSLGYYNGISWVKIPTNTDLDIVDLHGDYNPETREYELLALASTDASHLNGSKLLKIRNNSVSELSVNGINAYRKGDLWFFQGSNYWITGDGVYFKKNLSDSAWTPIENFPASNWVTADIGGWNPRDFFILQGDGHVLHYNGSTWKDFKAELGLHDISFYKVIIMGNMVLLLGGDHAYPLRGYIIRGRRL